MVHTCSTCYCSISHTAWGCTWPLVALLVRALRPPQHKHDRLWQPLQCRRTSSSSAAQSLRLARHSAASPECLLLSEMSCDKPPAICSTTCLRAPTALRSACTCAARRRRSCYLYSLTCCPSDCTAESISKPGLVGRDNSIVSWCCMCNTVALHARERPSGAR